MQLLVPIFPPDTKMINEIMGVQERDGIVYYLISGMPIYSHSPEDIQAFRYFTSNLIHQGLCQNVEIERAFGVSEDSVRRALRKFKTQGEAGFLDSIRDMETPTRSWVPSVNECRQNSIKGKV